VKLAPLAAATLLVASAVFGHASAHETAATSRTSMHAVVLVDGPGDVWTFSDFTTGHEPAAKPTADVLRARVVLGQNAFHVRMTFDDLRRVDTQRYWCDIRTPDGRTVRFVVEANDGHWRGQAWQEVEGEWIRVSGLSHHIDYASDVVTVRVARAVLAQPAWVRVRLRNELGLEDGGTFFTDNPTTASAQPTFTPRLETAGNRWKQGLASAAAASGR